MTMDRREHLPAIGTAASALLLTVTHPPIALSSIAWIALIPWLHSLQRCAGAKQAAIQGFWLHFLFGVGLSFSIVEVVPRYLGGAPILGWVALALLALLSQLQFVAFAPIFFWISRRAGPPLGPGGILLSSLLYAGLDWGIPSLFKDTLGMALHANRGLGQMVEVGGVYLLTAALVAGNLALLPLIRFASDPSARQKLFVSRGATGATGATTVAVLLLAAWAAGTHRHREVSQWIETPLRSVKVGIVQGNISNDSKHRWADGDPEAADQTLAIHIDLSEELLRGEDPPDLIVWPETSYPGIYRRPENERQLLNNVALDRYIGATGKTFAFGAYDLDDRVRGRVLQNAMFFVQPTPEQGTLVPSPMDVYHKHILFPVGESSPFSSGDSLRQWLPNAGTLSGGGGPEVFDLQLPGQRSLKVGPIICYEDTFSSHTAGLARGGAELLINITDDSWFGEFGLPESHMIYARLKSMETRLPQIRAANSGFSALILPSGDVLHASEFGTRTTLDLQVPITGPRRTWMTIWGDWFGATSLIIAAIGLLMLEVRSRNPAPPEIPSAG